MNQSVMTFEDVKVGGICLQCKSSLHANAKPHDECKVCGSMIYDLFFHYDAQPKNLRDITNKYGNLLDVGAGDKYELCKQFVEAVEAIGYTFEYGLSGECCGLRALSMGRFTTNVIPDSVVGKLRECGFVDYEYANQEGVFLRKELQCGALPDCAYIDGVEEDTDCVVEICEDGRIQLYIADIDLCEMYDFKSEREGFFNLICDATGLSREILEK